jgi:hypothetical protein
MIRALRILLVCTVIFHIVRTTYQLNVLEQKVQSINVVMARIHAERTHAGAALEALKKDAAPGLDMMDKTYVGPPHASQQFIDEIKSGKVTGSQ